MEDPYRFPPILSDLDLYLLGEGTHMHLYEKLGAHPMVLDGVEGVAFVLRPSGSAWLATSISGMDDATPCGKRMHARHSILDAGNMQTAVREVHRSPKGLSAPRASRYGAGQIFLCLWMSWRPANLTASSLLENARTGSLRVRMTRPAPVSKCTLKGAGSGSGCVVD
jgi:hypothetical protein